MVKLEKKYTIHETHLEIGFVASLRSFVYMRTFLSNNFLVMLGNDKILEENIFILYYMGGFHTL